LAAQLSLDVDTMAMAQKLKKNEGRLK